jgi:hypothetical protein
VGDVIEFAAIALGIIAFLAGGVVLAKRRRLTRLLPAIEVGSYREQKKAVAKAVELLRLQISDRDSPFRQQELVLVRAPVWLRRHLKAALCLFGLGGLLTMGAATAIIVSKEIDIEQDLGKILYDLVIAIVFGGTVGVVTGLYVERIIKRRDDARWRSVRRLYYVAISGILGRLLNDAVPNDLKARGESVTDPLPIEATNFKPKTEAFFYEFHTWHPIIEDLLGRVSPTKPLNSEPLLLIEPLRKAIEALEKLFRTYGPVGDPELAKLIGTIVTMSIRFNDFAASTADWKYPNNVHDYYNQVVILLRLSYELRTKIMASGEVTAARAEN